MSEGGALPHEVDEGHRARAGGDLAGREPELPELLPQRRDRVRPVAFHLRRGGAPDGEVQQDEAAAPARGGEQPAQVAKTLSGERPTNTSRLSPLTARRRVQHRRRSSTNLG